MSRHLHKVHSRKNARLSGFGRPPLPFQYLVPELHTIAKRELEMEAVSQTENLQVSTWHSQGSEGSLLLSPSSS